MAGPHVLLVEDDAADAALIASALTESGVSHRLHLARSAPEALAFARREGDFQSVPRPDLLLLDLKLGGQSGYEVLRAFKEDDALRLIPVVVLTGSEAEGDVWRAYHAHANAYVAKAADPAIFAQNLRALTDFFLHVAQLPPAREPQR